MTSDVNIDIKSLTRDELSARLVEWREPHYRLDQLLNWLYANRVRTWDAMSNLPKKLRQRLAESFMLHTLELAALQGSDDATRKFLWRLRDHAFIESVLIPANPALYGDASDRHTLCISTQVGCAYGCGFCASGLDGWKRNLTPDEIVEQVLAVERWHGEETNKARIKAMPPAAILAPAPTPNPGPKVEVRPPVPVAPRLINNVVVMGMGEPLANYENLLKALQILNAPWGGHIGARKITVSTSGLAPEIRKLADEPMQLRLAVSLHGATDEIRNRLMPVNRKYPLAELVAACEYYQAHKGRMITFEYILIAGVNDHTDHARPLAELSERLNAKINLIPYNHVEGLAWQRPSDEAQEAFLAELTRLGTKATLRREKGHDIDAACGQLRLRTERELATAA
ncbi:MAG: 23S rRNA (adenine(2503)-C(2))-methyltransferase RlmN [Verrucomicrobia bacterium]|nr:23S rRNA (adenine(2503)-C(2))-methyltransferase RlmN [Verrucomicrobiota bacterium]